jgi:hypothetical protein
LSYNSRGGHGYGGNQRRRSGNSSPYQRRNPTKNCPNQNINLKSTAPESANQRDIPFTILAKAKQTWDQPAWSSKLPNNSDPEQIAYELIQAAINSNREIELQVLDPKTKMTTRYLLRKREDLEAEQQQAEDILPLEGQSFEAHQNITALDQQLRIFGWSLVLVKKKGITP